MATDYERWHLKDTLDKYLASDLEPSELPAHLTPNQRRAVAQVREATGSAYLNAFVGGMALIGAGVSGAFFNYACSKASWEKGILTEYDHRVSQFGKNDRETKDYYANVVQFAESRYHDAKIEQGAGGIGVVALGLLAALLFKRLGNALGRMRKWSNVFVSEGMYHHENQHE